MSDSSKANTSAASTGVSQRPIRWWPVLVILLLQACSAIFVRLFPWPHRQDRNIAIANVVVIPFLLLLLWCLFFSRLKWKLRLSVLGAVVGSILLTMATFRFHGVTGDLVPILEWRWNRRAF